MLIAAMIKNKTPKIHDDIAEIECLIVTVVMLMRTTGHLMNASNELARTSQLRSCGASPVTYAVRTRMCLAVDLLLLTITEHHITTVYIPIPYLFFL